MTAEQDKTIYDLVKVLQGAKDYVKSISTKLFYTEIIDNNQNDIKKDILTDITDLLMNINYTLKKYSEIEKYDEQKENEFINQIEKAKEYISDAPFLF